MVKEEFRHARTRWVIMFSSLLPRATIALSRAHLLIQAKLELLEYGLPPQRVCSQARVRCIDVLLASLSKASVPRRLSFVRQNIFTKSFHSAEKSTASLRTTSLECFSKDLLLPFHLSQGYAWFV